MMPESLVGFCALLKFAINGELNRALSSNHRENIYENNQSNFIDHDRCNHPCCLRRARRWPKQTKGRSKRNNKISEVDRRILPYCYDGTAISIRSRCHLSNKNMRMNRHHPFQGIHIIYLHPSLFNGNHSRLPQRTQLPTNGLNGQP